MKKTLQCTHGFVLLTSIILSFLLASCSHSGSSDQGEIFIKVVDAPANYQAINIVVNRVSIHQSGAAPNIGLTFLSTTSPIKFNLLKLLNGNSVQLALSKVPAGTYDQIEINYGQCTITINGQEIPLNFDPSITNGNSIIPFSFQIVDGQQFQLTFDYDAYSSVYPTGFLNSYNFNPKIRLQNTALSGSIAGTIRDPNNAVTSARITTFTGLDSVTTYNDTTYGSFQLSDLPEDTSYTVIIIPYNQSLLNDTLPGIIVTRQTITNLGIIQLKYK